MTKHKVAIVAVSAALLYAVAFLHGRSSAPSLVEKRTEALYVDRWKTEVTRVTVASIYVQSSSSRRESGQSVTLPDGTVTISWLIDEKVDVSSHTALKVDEKVDARRDVTGKGVTVEKVLRVRPDWLIDVRAGLLLSEPSQRVLSGAVYRRLVAGLYAGVWADTNATFGAGAALTF